MQWPSFETSGVSVPSSVTSNVWHDGAWNGEEQVSVTATGTQPWNAFEDSVTPAPVDGLNQGLLKNLPSTDDQFLDSRASEVGLQMGSNEGGMQGIAPFGRFDDHVISSSFSVGSAYPPSAIPPMGESQPNGNSHKSTNPFDFLDNSDVSDVEHRNMFLDLGSLQAALPDAQLPPTFHSGIDEPWLPQNSVSPYISSAGQGGGLTFMAAQPPSSQIPNIQTPESVASFGGNPFA
ncbi:hypothetical protein PIB30_047805 [Stylosanthes scabra]|uniref:Uncharacterized protein n=1 Tax=Stylosanthes scabra TaxID=79078 RepID=A0ABU6XFW6_9FABA|nr:hypothetical protein [Stylosanthes scabra]